MSKPKKVTQYMREQIAALSPEDLKIFVDQTKFTPEQRKAILQRLGEIERDPKSSPAEMKAVETVRESIEGVDHDNSHGKAVAADPVKLPDPQPITEQPKKPEKIIYLWI